MDGGTLYATWPILAALGYLLLTAVLTVLAYSRKHQVELHQRVRDSLLLRREYAQAADRDDNGKGAAGA